MAVKMRLRREGKKKQPFYRVVVADVRSPRDGRFIEDIGYYQPTHQPSTIQIDHNRALYWLRTGVQPSEAVTKLLRIEGIWEEFRPGDTGKDRSAKHEQRAAATAAKESARRDAEEAVRRERADAAAAAEAEREAEREAEEAARAAAEAPEPSDADQETEAAEGGDAPAGQESSAEAEGTDQETATTADADAPSATPGADAPDEGSQEEKTS